MVLVTGATGLVGAYLLLQLSGSGKRIRALYRTEQHILKTKNIFSHHNQLPLFDAIEWVQGDITDVPSLEEAFAGVEYVYHCAALISYDPSDEEKLRKVNIEGTANMVNCALAFGVKKFCHVSSVSALGDTRDGTSVITEETEWNPEKNHSDYAISKHGAEMEVWRARQEGLDVIIINPGLIFGYGFNGQGSGEIITSVKKGMYFYTLGNVGVVAVEDVVKVMTALMDADIQNERYTLIAENMSLKKMLDMIANGLKQKRPPYYANPAMTSFAWRADWLFSKLTGRKRKLSYAMAKSSHNTETYDNSKIKNALGYTFISPDSFLKQAF